MKRTCPRYECPTFKLDCLDTDITVGSDGTNGRTDRYCSTGCIASSHCTYRNDVINTTDRNDLLQMVDMFKLTKFCIENWCNLPLSGPTDFSCCRVQCICPGQSGILKHESISIERLPL